MVDILSYGFFLNALIASLLSAVVCGYVGVYIVSRRIVFISGGISHASFGGIGIAYYMGFNPVAGAACFAVLSAMGVEFLSDKSSRLRNDTLIGMLWSFGMAVGIIFIFMTPGYSADLMSYLFGNILAVPLWYLISLAAITLVTVLFFHFFNKEIILSAFDSEFARVQRVPVKALNYTMMAVVALAIVITIKVSGIILVIAMLTIPPAVASLFTRRFMTMVLLSAVSGMVFSTAGLFISFGLGIPTGASIIFTGIISYLILRLFVSLRRFKKNSKTTG